MDPNDKNIPNEQIEETDQKDEIDYKSLITKIDNRQKTKVFVEFKAYRMSQILKDMNLQIMT